MKKTNWLSKKILLLLLINYVVFGASGCNPQNRTLEHQLSAVLELRVLNVRIVKYAAEASDRKVEAFSLLKGTTEEFDRIVQTLRMGDPKNVAALPVDVESELATLERRWKDVKKNTDIILDKEGVIRILKEFVHAFDDASAELLLVSNKIAEQLSDKNIRVKVMYHATYQTTLLNKITLHVNKMLRGGPKAGEDIDQISRAAAQFGRILNALLNGDNELKIKKITNPKIVANLQKAANLFKTQNELLKKILQRSKDYLLAKDANHRIFLQSEILFADVELLFERLDSLAR